MQSPKTPITPAVKLLVTTGFAVNWIMYQSKDNRSPCESSGTRFDCCADCHSHSPANSNHVCHVVGLPGEVGRIMVEAAAVALSEVDDKAALATDGVRNGIMAMRARETTLRLVVFLSNPNFNRDPCRCHGFRILGPSCALSGAGADSCCVLKRRRVLSVV